MQQPSDSDSPPPNFVQYISRAADALGVDLTSKECSTSQKDIQGILKEASVIRRADEVQQFRTVELTADAAKRDKLIAQLSQPDKVGPYIVNLRFFRCDEWLIDSPDAFRDVNVITQQATMLRLIHIKHDLRYLDWALIPRHLQTSLRNVIGRVNVIVMEGVKNIPISLLSSSQTVQSLELALVQLAAPTSRNAWPTATSRPLKLAVHAGLAAAEDEQVNRATLDTIRRLKGSTSMQLDALTTLYLDQLGCNGCTKTWKEIIKLCEPTLLNLRLNYKYEGNSAEITDDELVNLGGLRSLHSLFLAVVAHPLSIIVLGRILNTFNITGARFLNLGFCIDARQTPRGRNWTDELVLDSGQVAYVADWAAVDQKLAQVLKTQINTKISFRLPRAKKATQGIAEAYIKKALSSMMRQNGKRFKLESVEQEFPLHRMFSLSEEEAAL